MRPARRLSALAAACLVFAALGLTTATTHGDCESGDDAGDTPATALQVRPTAYCTFTLEGHADTVGHDYFSFGLEGGRSAYLVYVSSALHGLRDPSGQSYAMTLPVTTLESSTSGEWLLHFSSPFGFEDRDYAFGIYLNKSHFEGQVLVGGALTHGFEDDRLRGFDGVNGHLGPGESPVVDGQWFDLPAETTGIEMLFATSGEPSVWFYDADGEWIDHADCGFASLTSCHAPAGAVRVLVTDNDFGVSGPLDDFRFAFDLYW